jgi:hypothetical protein
LNEQGRVSLFPLHVVAALYHTGVDKTMPLPPGMNIYPTFLKFLMQTIASSNLDQEIKKYKAAHGGNSPLYLMMSAEEADELTSTMKHEDGQSKEIIITVYNDIKIIRNSLMERGVYFLSNELPETGS